MKKLFNIHLVLAIGFLVFTTSCSHTTKVGFLMDKSKEGRWIKDKEVFINSVMKSGGEVVFRATDIDNLNQYELAKEMFKEGIDVLVIIPTDLNEAAKIVAVANKEGIKVIAYERLIKNCNLDFFISFDHVIVGEQQASYILSCCPKGKYAIIGGATNDNNSLFLHLGQLSVLQPSVEKEDIKIVFDNYVKEWTVAEGERLMMECLVKNKDIDAVIPANDMLAEGVIKALKANGITKKVFLAGMDADLEACQRIMAGTQTMTVYKPIEAIAVKASELALQLANSDNVVNANLSTNNGYKQVPSLLLSTMIVNSQTIGLTVIADGYLKENNIDITKK